MPYEKLKSEQYTLLGGLNTKVSLYKNAPFEFRDLTNLNFISIGALSKRPGTSLYVGATVGGIVSGGVEFNKLDGSSYIIITANTTAYKVAGGAFNPFKTGLLNNAIFSFTTFVDHLFAGNGKDFFKYDGSNVWLFSLPPGITGNWGATAAPGGGLSGTYFAAYGYLNDRGYYGPPSNGFTVILDGTTNGSILYYGLTSPPSDYGATAIALYRSAPDFTDLVGTTLALISSTTVTDNGFPLTTRTAEFNLWFTLAPKYLEIYNNQLFLAGFSAFPSTVFWSQIGEPEGISPDFFNEFRTNDGDRIFGMKSYNGALVVAKERSFHLLTGDNPSNFTAIQLSDQYGCISDRTMIVYENMLWFLDVKGICQYNGANIEIISNKVEPIFAMMNLSAARDSAVGLHFKQFNEVWFSIPVNGATMNNITIVYDYVAQAWTKYEGFNASVLFSGVGTLPTRSIIAGGYSGNVFFFGQSITSDFGNAFTCMMLGGYIDDMGNTVTKQYRRLYLDMDPIAGSSQALAINFFSDYGSSNLAGTGIIYQAPFQTRLDFGIPAKSLSVQAFHVSASLPLRINGYTFEYRFQRAV